jgi:putative hemolysin
MLYIELGVVAALIFLNGLLAMAELAVVSSRRSRLQALVERDVTGSRRALVLASDPGRFLSTVQIGITLVGVLSGAFSGATLGLRFANWLASFGIPLDAAEIIAVAVVVAAITYASLIVGELVPKQIALRNPEKIATRVAPAMTVLAKIASPLVTLLDASGKILLRMLGQRTQPEHRVSDEEIQALIAEAETAGVLEPNERAMISAVMRLGDRRVRAIMTPRAETEMINLSDDSKTMMAALRESVHSRLPAHDGNPDEIVGVLQAKDLLDAYLGGKKPKVRDYVRHAPFIPDTVDALDVVAVIKESPVHMALVLDEYGHFEGVVTNADILEAIVGAFRTDEATEPQAVQRDDGSWLISGSMPIDEMQDRLSISLLERPVFNTAAGLALDALGELPGVGESFEVDGWRFEIVDLDGRRIDKLLATRITGRRRKNPILSASAD